MSKGLLSAASKAAITASAKVDDAARAAAKTAVKSAGAAPKASAAPRSMDAFWKTYETWIKGLPARAPDLNPPPPGKQNYVVLRDLALSWLH